ncbi:MAG: hypothetical protein RLZZ360_680 [Candidatus Parcubacteria bacterium]|jgi:hypothetical protein
MKALVQQKAKAIELRKRGYTYKEIQKVVPVAKSSLSLWFRDLPLSKSEKKILQQRKDDNISKGRIRAAGIALIHREEQIQRLFEETKKEFSRHCHNSLFHTGVAVYWAEGAKRSNQFLFVNSDESMIALMLKWLITFTGYQMHEFGFRLYIHAPYAQQDLESWWQHYLGVSTSQFRKTIIKPTSLGIKKRPNYKGCLRIEVPRSSILLLKMKFFINLQVEHHLKK